MGILGHLNYHQLDTIWCNKEQLKWKFQGTLTPWQRSRGTLNSLGKVADPQGWLMIPFWNIEIELCWQPVGIPVTWALRMVTEDRRGTARSYRHPWKEQARDGADRGALLTGDQCHCGFSKSADEFWYQMTAPGTKRGFWRGLLY